MQHKPILISSIAFVLLSSATNSFPLEHSNSSWTTTSTSMSLATFQAPKVQLPSLDIRKWKATAEQGSSLVADNPSLLGDTSSLLTTRSSLETSSSVLNYKSGLQDTPSILATQYQGVLFPVSNQTATEYAHAVMQHAVQTDPNLNNITQALAKQAEAERSKALSTQPAAETYGWRVTVTPATVITHIENPSMSRANSKKALSDGAESTSFSSSTTTASAGHIGVTPTRVVTDSPRSAGVAVYQRPGNSDSSAAFSRTQITLHGYIKSTPATLTTNVSTLDGRVTSMQATGPSFEGQVNPMPKPGFCLPSPTKAIVAASIGRTTAAGAQYCGATQQQVQYTNIATTVAASAVMHCCRSDQENRTVMQFLIQLALDGVCYQGINWLLPVQTTGQNVTLKEVTKKP